MARLSSFERDAEIKCRSETSSAEWERYVSLSHIDSRMRSALKRLFLQDKTNSVESVGFSTSGFTLDANLGTRAQTARFVACELISFSEMPEE
jgi:hypothetical protein